MTFKLPLLPYALDALEPLISKETLEYHYGKHHQAYVNKLNELIAGTEYTSLSLEAIICQSTSGPIFNNAAQVWNHAFYWHCLSPTGGNEPHGSLQKQIEQYFGSVSVFQSLFTKAALQQFGSGWAWLVMNATGALEILNTGNAENPLTSGYTPLLTCDVWEHAYYIDTRNDRAQYLNNFWQCVNWNFAADNLQRGYLYA